MTLSAQVAEHITTCPVDSLSATARDATRRALLDAVGVMIAASRLSQDVQPFLAEASASDGPCLVLGGAHRSSALAAAGANGALAHALDFEDTFDAAALHPNAAMIPAAMAVAEQRGGVDGATFVTALALGCDLVCRLGLALREPVSERGWYPPLLLGAYGATAACARIAGLSAEQTLDALSLTLCIGSAPGAIGSDPRTTLRATREAFAAEAAVRAVALAARGVRGFEQPLEGTDGFYALYAGGNFDSDAILSSLGQFFYGEQLSFKRWPTCRGTHTFIEMALALREENPDAIGNIQEISVDIGAIQRQLIEPRERKSAPLSAIDARFSIPFTVALALLKGEVTLHNVAGCLEDPDVLALSAKVTPRPRPDWGRDHATAGAMQVTLADGNVWRGERLIALGHPDHPLDTDELVAKFCAAFSLAGNPQQAATAAQQLLSIDTRARSDFGFLAID
ncbi:MmgE/PrpD family protein [Parahaliea maris]|uniref:MmgE/PrpD family protein n=2 Tax=Parahaliea maris TaxID=2716870 RepID=A0A5C8ZP92_9GAMM|nr:MmgE/PrpD family protein [Parahaliea maris]